MPLIVAPDRPIVAQIGRVLRKLGVVTRLRDHGRGIRNVVDYLAECVRELTLDVPGEATAELERHAVIHGVGGALKRNDTVEIQVRSRAREAGIGKHRAFVRHRDRSCRRNPHVYVAGPLQMRPLDEEVGCAEGGLRRQTQLRRKAPLLHVRIHVVWRENEDGRLGQCHAARDGRQPVRPGRRDAAGEGDSLHTEAVVGVGGPDHDRRSASVEDPIAAAKHQTIPGGHGLPGKPDTGSHVVSVGIENARVDPVAGKLRVRILCRGLLEGLKVEPRAEIQGQTPAHAPVILEEDRELQDVRACRSSRGSSTGKSLDVAFARARGSSPGEAGQRREAVRPREVAREKVQDAVDVEIDPDLQIMVSTQM